MYNVQTILKFWFPINYVNAIARLKSANAITYTLIQVKFPEMISDKLRLGLCAHLDRRDFVVQSNKHVTWYFKF